MPFKNHSALNVSEMNQGFRSTWVTSITPNPGCLYKKKIKKFLVISEILWKF